MLAYAPVAFHDSLEPDQSLHNVACAEVSTDIHGMQSNVKFSSVDGISRFLA